MVCNRLWLLILAAIAAAAGVVQAQHVASQRPPTVVQDPAELGRADVFPVRLDTLGSQRGQRIPHGSASEAKVYYRRLGEELTFPGNVVPARLDGLLQYLGFQALKAADLDRLPAQTLMSYDCLRHRYQGQNEFTPEKAPADWSILAQTYFAPKTSDVSGRSNKLSWRKIVRLLPLPGSPAERDGISALYLLSVAYLEPHELEQRSPAEAPTVNLQVMLVKHPERETRLTESVCFLVYDPAKDYALSLSTTTSWDAADPHLLAGLQPYHVPHACRECHNEGKEATSHFIDTDYSLDRVLPGDDFAASVGRSRYGSLLEAGQNPNREQYQQSMAVYRQLNLEIKQHNQAINPDSPQSLGAENWWRLHGAPGSTALHRLPIERGWRGETMWGESREVDRNLLPLLNRYCYRCHGTIYYNVYDKPTVLEWAADMLAAIESGKMPMDRRLKTEEKAELVLWLRRLQAEPK